jgi:hypothetical protein
MSKKVNSKHRLARTWSRQIAVMIFFLWVGSGERVALARGPENSPIEPNAGNWRTWVISSGED